MPLPVPLPLALGVVFLVAQRPDSVAPADGRGPYPDSNTAALVLRLRAARERNERLVTAYTATVKQRIGVGVRALARDRMLYRSELVARIGWKRDAPSTIELVGAREGIPIALRGDRVPEDLEDQARGLVLNPAQDYLRLFGSERNEGFVYPLRPGSEADYRFEAGDTAAITLPTGQRIRLLSLKVTPRRSDWRLVAGTFWFDADSYGLVQAVFRPARPYEFRRDADPQDREDVPGFVNPVAEVKFITLEYGLYEARWWMPRYVAIDAAGALGSWLHVPLRIERVYQDYEVEGGTPPPPGSTFRPAGTIRRPRDSTPADSAERRRVADSVRAAVRRCLDQAEAETEGAGRRARGAAARRCGRAGRDSSLVVVIPEDTTALLASPELGPPILAMGDLIAAEDVRSLRDAIGQLPSPRWGGRVELPRGTGALLQHARYNRIEALSLGLSGRLALGTMGRLEGLARLGLADRVPNGELGLTHPTSNGRLALAVYRRLAAANPDTKPLGTINSLLGLLAQRDDGQYYRAAGAELVAGNANAGWWSARLFVEHQTAARVETSASLPRLFDDTRRFRPNILADRADQVGGALTFRGTTPLSPAVALGGEISLDGATGDYDLARAATTLRLFVTPPGPLAWALSASAGTSTGDLPVQSRFYLGGAPTLRGYAGGVVSGTAYWAGRLEVGNSFPAVRLIAFSDVGWAGDRGRFGRGGEAGRTLVGAGVGASLLDGLVRLDLARGLRAPRGWRLEFYLDGVL